MSNIQSALNTKEAKFTKGVYKITQPLQVNSNCTIDLNGSSLRRYCSNYILRFHNSPSTTAYNGIHDVVVKNGTIEGMSGPGYRYAAGSLVSMMHCKNITFENVTFLDDTGCHCVDVVGCQNVKFINCKFLGYNTVGNDFREAIQIDFAYALGLPAYDKSSKCYDMTRCKDILIDKCTFGKSSTFPAQYVAIGSHTQANDKLWHENITIQNCTAVGNGGKDGWLGYFVDIMNWKNVVIKNNTVSDYARFVLVNKAKTLYNKDGSTTGNISGQLNCENLTIENNTVKSHKGTATAWGIYIDAPSVNKVTVKNNKGVAKSGCYIKGNNLNIMYIS